MVSNLMDSMVLRLNVDVGPNRKVDKLTAYYAHMKALLPTWRRMVNEEEVARDTCINFRSDGRW